MEFMEINKFHVNFFFFRTYINFSEPIIRPVTTKDGKRVEFGKSIHLIRKKWQTQPTRQPNGSMAGWNGLTCRIDKLFLCSFKKNSTFLFFWWVLVG